MPQKTHPGVVVVVLSAPTGHIRYAPKYMTCTYVPSLTVGRSAFNATRLCQPAKILLCPCLDEIPKRPTVKCGNRCAIRLVSPEQLKWLRS
jgi:hypothetical protein